MSRGSEEEESGGQTGTEGEGEWRTDRQGEGDRQKKETETEMAQLVANGSSQFAALVFGLALFSVLRSGPVTLQ